MEDPRLTFVRYHVAWMLATVSVLVAVERFSLPGFYVLSTIGFYLVTELTATDGLRIAWRRRVRIVGVLLGLGFVGVVLLQVRAIVA